jgi:hypothetical protein
MSLVRRAVRYELGMWVSLFRWITGRPRNRDPQARTFGYASAVTPVFGAFIGVSAIELPILHFVLPWEPVRIAADALGFYGLFWMFGLLASFRVNRHAVGPEGLRIRHGASVDLLVPWDAVAGITRKYRSASGARGIRVADGLLQLVIGGQTSIDVELREPIVVRLPAGDSPPLRRLRFHADDADALVAAARDHLPAPSRS